MIVYDILFYAIWSGYTYYKLIAGFRSLLSAYKIGPCTNDTLSVGFTIVLGCGLISLILWIMALVVKKELPRQILYWMRWVIDSWLYF